MKRFLVNFKREGLLLSRFRSIRTAMLFSFSVLIVSALAVFMLLSLNYTEETVLENSSEYTMQLIERVNADLDSYITYMANISDIVANNKDVTDYFFADLSNGKKFDLKTRIYAQFNTLRNARNDIYNIGVLTEEDYVLNNGKNRINEYAGASGLEWYKKALQKQEDIALSASHVQNIVKNDYKWVVTLSRGIRNPRTNQVESVFFVDLNYSAINDLCEKISLGSKGYIYIIDENGSIIYHPKQQLLYSGIRTELYEEVLNSPENSFMIGEGKDRRLYTISQSDMTNWTIVGVAYLDEMMGKRVETLLSYLLISIMLFSAALLIAIFLSREITRPVTNLEKSMKEVEKGNFDNVELEILDKNEIGSLTNSFNIMTKEIQHLMLENIEEQRAKRKSELKALQSQINPHFLYNTLDSIIWMAESGKTQEVVLMTASLAKLLRQSISNEEEIVSIRREIDYVKQYLTIQKMRYQDKMEYEIDIQEEILRKEIVKLTLQPLVENALYHGIKYKEGKGMIYITGCIEDEDILIQISDNGAGMDDNQLTHILDAKEQKNGGVGVRNVQDRLQLFYGRKYGLTYQSCLGDGTRVTVRIPKEYRKDER